MKEIQEDDSLKDLYNEYADEYKNIIKELNDFKDELKKLVKDLKTRKLRGQPRYWILTFIGLSRNKSPPAVVS